MMNKRGLTGRKLKDRLLRIFSVFAVGIALGAMGWILATVFAHGIGVWNADFFLNASAPYGTKGGGVANAILGTLLITLGAAALSVVPALLAGIFLSEFKEYKRSICVLRFSANVLMGVPSVLIGLFVYMILVVPSGNFSGFAGALALALIMFPVVMRTTEEMLALVPYALRESALALGMTRMRTTVAIVCRSARGGLVTGILLALARVAGETAPLLFTALFSDALFSDYFSEPTANLPVLITEYATNSPFPKMHQIGWGAALVVCVFVLMLNIVTRICFREKKHGN